MREIVDIPSVTRLRAVGWMRASASAVVPAPAAAPKKFEMYPMPEMYEIPDMAAVCDAGRDADAAPTSRDCQVELVEEIPTGHATPLALEVTTILVEPSSASTDDRIELPALAPLAFGAPLARAPIDPTGGLAPRPAGRAVGVPTPRDLASPIARTTTAVPFADPADHLTALFDLVAARAVLAIAEGWYSGRISDDAIDHHLFTRELFSLVVACGSNADPLAPMRQRVASQADTITARVIASLAAGVELPLLELARELDLSELAMQLLVATLAPRARREIARLYRVLATEPGRPTCDDAVLAALLAGDDARMRDQLCAELADAAKLSRHWLVLRDSRGGLDVDDALLARLRGQPCPRSAATTMRAAERTLDELVIDRGTLRSLVLELAAPRDPEDPVRVVLRGRRGSGRHATIAALAARVDRRIACIDAGQLPHGPARAEALRRELARAVIARAIPVVSGIEVRDTTAPEAVARVAQILRAHPGPLVVRTSEHTRVPLETGALDVVLAPLSEADRRRAFASALERHAIPANAESLASRHRIGPGTIARVAIEARRRIERGDDDPAAIVDAVTRQHVAARIGSAATRVTRLATWDQVLLPDDVLDSLHELIGRARHGRTVFDEWGYDPRGATAHGLTAVFYGAPGTGKTMVASLVARELGLELYRVDLAKLMSRWAEQTENHLDELFDAAEEGQFMLVFDDVGSLFAGDKPEVEHLLRRLAAFDGVAIVTIDVEGSLVAALKRRMSMQLRFPLPDETLRAQLWAAHVTPQVPTAGRLDFAALARRFPLSGGDIRNCALRAAFLAAQDCSALTHAHLERAALLEIRDLGEPGDGQRLD